MSDSLSAAAQPVRVQGKLSGLCYENTVIDRKGRIRKVKPPTAKKPDFGSTSHQKLDDHHHHHHHQQQQQQQHQHHHHRPSVPQKNFDRSPGARLEDLFDNRSFVIGNNNVDYAMQHQQQQQQLQQQQQQIQQQQQQQLQQQQEQQQAWYEQQLSDMDRRHREQIWWRERPSSKSVSSTRNSCDDVAIQVVPNRPGKPQIPTKHSRSQQTDNNYYLRSKESSRKTDKNSASQSVEGAVQNPGHSKHGHANKSCETPNARRIQRAEDTSALARDARQGAVDPRDALGYKQAPLFQYPGGDAVVNDVLRGVNDYREVLARNANLNWTPQRIQKHNIRKIDNVVFNNNNGNRFQPISDNNSDNNNDVYEIALNQLVEAAVDDDTEDDDNDDDRNACFSQRSESPDTLVERILENVDETGMIVDLVLDEPAASQGTAKRSSTRLQASKKSFSDEILERLDSPDQGYLDAVRGPRSGYDTRQSRTLEPVRKLRSSTDRSSKYQKSKDTNSLADRSNSTPTTQLNPHFIRQQKNTKTSDNIGFDYPSLQTSPAAFPPSSVETPLFSGPQLALQEPRFFDNGRPTREPSPEEVFEEIMESIHDTEEDYDEPFFLQWPSLLGRKGESLTRDGSGKNSVDYSIENDWLSFFYCNRVAGDKIASMAPCSSSDGSQSTGIFLNSSLSSSWIESKPSRSSTLPRTSSRPEPSGAAAAIFTPNVKHSEAGTLPNNSGSWNDDSWNDLKRAQVVEMERIPGRIDGEVASESDKVSPPKVVTSQARNIDYSPGREGTLNRLGGEQVEHRLPGECQKEEDLAENSVQQPDAKDLLFAALDSACVRNMELNSGLQEAARTVIRLEEDQDRPPVKANEGLGADDLTTNVENAVEKQHHEKKIAGFSESQADEHLEKCRKFLEYSTVDSNDAKAGKPEENSAPETEMSQSLVPDQERPIETTDRTSAVAFIDEVETTFRNALLDTINECDDDDDDDDNEDSKLSKDKDDEVASEPVDGDGRPDPPGSARNLDEKSTSGLVTAEEEEEVEIPGSVLQPPSTRSVQVISDEVTSQTVVLKIAWPSGKNRERGASSRKDQPFRELQLRRTIRMSEPSPKTRTTGSNDDDDDEGSSRKKRTSEVVTSQVLPQNRKPSDAMTSPADVIVEYENREQSRTAEALDAGTSVDVTQTDSVRVLLVPATASYAVPDLKEIVASVGQTILQDSGRIPASSNIRVTCEAVQSKSCAALKEQEDITIINDTIFDTTKSIEDACK